MALYYSTQRPVGPGTFPVPEGNRVYSVTNYGSRKWIETIAREAWGQIEYVQPLPAEEADRYELTAAETGYRAKEARYDTFKRRLGLIAEKADPLFGSRLMELLDTEIGKSLLFWAGSDDIIDYTIWRREDVEERIRDYDAYYGDGELTETELREITDEVVDYLEGKADCEGPITAQDIDYAVDTAMESLDGETE